MRIVFLLLFLIITGCDPLPKESTQLNNESKSQKKELKQPRIYKFNKDSLKTYIAGTEQFPTVQIQKADHSNRVLLRGPRPIIPGRSFLPQTKEDLILGKKPIKSKLPTITQIVGAPTINTPGTGVFEKPLAIEVADPVIINLDSIKDFRERIIKNKKYTIQNKDTILPPLRVMAKQQPSSTAKKPNFKDNAILDVQYLDIDHGLSQSQVTDVIEQENGDIWLSYRGSGLSRYDGIRFAHFGLDQGLNDGDVNKLIKDRNGNIWIATSDNGVSKYDGQYFTWYTTDQGLQDNLVLTLLERSNGDIIIGTSNGISIFNGEELINYNEKQGFPAGSIRGLSEDTKNNIWIASEKLIKFDGNKFHIYSQRSIVEAGPISSVLEDKKGNIWFGTFDSGIYLMQGKSLFSYATPQGFTNSSIISIFEDKSENIWFTTFDEGIFKFDGESFTNYNSDHGLRNNTVFSITEDSGGKLWLGANGDGVSIFNPNSFTHFTTKQGLTNNWATKIFEDENNNLWFASWGGGLYKFDGEFYTHYTTNEGMLYDWVNGIVKDKNNNLWVTSEYGVGGLSMFDQKKFTNYLVHEIIPEVRLTCIEIDANGDLWLGTLYNGILKFSTESGLAKFTHFDYDFLKRNYIVALYQDKSKNMWIGTLGNGLFIFDGAEFIHFQENNGLVDDRVTYFSEDTIGNIRIGTANGFSIYDGTSFRNLTTKDGLVHNYIRTFVDDKNGNQWVSTRGGISLLDKDYLQLYNFTRDDGIKSVDFKRNSGLLDSRGKLWWGTGKAITTLDLNTLELPKGSPKIKINEILINQKHYDYRQFSVEDKDSLGIYFEDVPAFHNIPKDLVLPYKNNDITIHYTGIDWKAPHQIKYQTRLKGLFNRWSEPTTETTVMYRKLSHGDYIFQMKAIGATNEWSDIVEYSFVINAPWWHTWWARTIYALLFILLMIIIVRIRTNYLIKSRKALEKEVENRTIDLKETQTQLIQSEKMASLGQLTAGIAHEINNPVSFTRTSSFALDQDLKDIKQLIKKYREFIQKNDLDTKEINEFEKSIDHELLLSEIDQSIADIKEGTKRTSEIVKGLSEFSHIDHEKMEPADIHQGIDNTLGLLKSKFNPKIKITKNYDRSIGLINSHIGQLNQVFLNLLINALDAIGPEGEIIIATRSEGDQLLISIEDNGKGIPEDIVNKIFDPFFTTKKIGDGTGLGLSISHGIIKNHGGTITVKSSIEKGTVFEIRIPKG